MLTMIMPKPPGHFDKNQRILEVEILEAIRSIWC